VCVLLLLVVTPARVRADGTQNVATGTVQGLSEPLSLTLSDRMVAVAAIGVFDEPGALAMQSPHDGAAAPNAIPEPEEGHLNRVGFFIGATTKTNGDTEAAVGVEYERHLTELFGLGLLVEWEPGFEERFLTAPAFFIHPVGDLQFVLAPGVQFEDGHGHFVFRVGAAWEFELGRGFSLAPAINYDFVESEHDAISYGLVVSFSF